MDSNDQKKTRDHHPSHALVGWDDNTAKQTNQHRRPQATRFRGRSRALSMVDGVICGDSSEGAMPRQVRPGKILALGLRPCGGNKVDRSEERSRK